MSSLVLCFRLQFYFNRDWDSAWHGGVCTGAARPLMYRQGGWEEFHHWQANAGVGALMEYQVRKSTLLSGKEVLRLYAVRSCASPLTDACTSVLYRYELWQMIFTFNLDVHIMSCYTCWHVFVCAL